MNIQNFMFQSNFLYSGQVINYKLVINYFSLITYANTKRALIFLVLGLFPCDKTKPYWKLAFSFSIPLSLAWGKKKQHPQGMESNQHFAIYDENSIKLMTLCHFSNRIINRLIKFSWNIIGFWDRTPKKRPPKIILICYIYISSIYRCWSGRLQGLGFLFRNYWIKWKTN